VAAVKFTLERPEARKAMAFRRKLCGNDMDFMKIWMYNDNYMIYENYLVFPYHYNCMVVPLL
jgi:hypothetical protein